MAAVVAASAGLGMTHTSPLLLMVHGELRTLPLVFPSWREYLIEPLAAKVFYAVQYSNTSFIDSMARILIESHESTRFAHFETAQQGWSAAVPFFARKAPSDGSEHPRRGDGKKAGDGAQGRLWNHGSVPPQWTTLVDPRYPVRDSLQRKAMGFCLNFRRLMLTARAALPYCKPDCFAIHMRPDLLIITPIVLGSLAPEPYHFPGYAKPALSLDEWKTQPVFATPSCTKYHGISDQIGIFNQHALRQLIVKGREAYASVWSTLVFEEVYLLKAMRIMGIKLPSFDIDYFFLRPRAAAKLFSDHRFHAVDHQFTYHDCAQHAYFERDLILQPPDWLLSVVACPAAPLWRRERCQQPLVADMFDRLAQAKALCEQGQLPLQWPAPELETARTFGFANPFRCDFAPGLLASIEEDLGPFLSLTTPLASTAAAATAAPSMQLILLGVALTVIALAVT